MENGLEGVNGNCFAVMARVKKILKNAEMESLISEYMEEAQSGNYDWLIQVSLEYIERAEREEKIERQKRWNQMVNKAVERGK